MSDSSEDEDLSRFIEAVDPTFVKLIDESRGKTLQCVTTGQPRSERYLEESSHYNDVKVPKEMQKCIGNKISAIINNLVEYVDVEQKSVKQYETKGGVKLFKNSEGYLSCKEVKDTYTKSHNKISRKSKWKQKKRLIDQDVSEHNELDKIKAAVVTGEYVLSKEDTKHWGSRRKEKLFTYKAHGKNKNILLEV
ncbi:uncharacterized protein LOC123871308 [Maniola jurtina]|uniref:uncharacterized protein LOC123871308 n=1 Tax=Maniola jurtina TaxID=191418 RepID=UPI001E68F4D7|nr:uncharacterized protein LOC123871308 [Maniola jurtina]XP_045771003.1 uncharacterized protein LOC123871308 [Maniola jurtina]